MQEWLWMATTVSGARDLVHGLDYIHNNTCKNITSLVHNHIKGSRFIVTESSLNAKICQFGMAQLCERQKIIKLASGKQKILKYCRRIKIIVGNQLDLKRN